MNLFHEVLNHEAPNNYCFFGYWSSGYPYGVPVVSSNTTAFPEIIGDAGILIAPNNEVEIAEIISE